MPLTAGVLFGLTFAVPFMQFSWFAVIILGGIIALIFNLYINRFNL